MLFPDSSTPLEPARTIRGCFLVMSDFVWAYARRGAGDDLLTLIGDTGLLEDGRPTDPAAWEDWVESMDWIADGNPPRTGSSTSYPDSPTEEAVSLTSREGFLITSDFLWEYGNREGDHLLAFLLDIALKDDGQPTNPRIWPDWLDSVKWIRSGNPPRFVTIANP